MNTVYMTLSTGDVWTGLTTCCLQAADLKLIRVLEAPNTYCHSCCCLLDKSTWRNTAFLFALTVL